MKFSTKQKGRLPEALVKYLVEEQHGGNILEKNVLKGDREVSTAGRNLVGGEQNGGGEKEPTIEMILTPRMLKPRRAYFLGKCKCQHDDMQLIMRIPAEMPNGESKILKVLIDTGAEANLIKIGLIPDHLFHSAKKVLHLITASGQSLAGGERTVDLGLSFVKEEEGVTQPGVFLCKAEFYEAAEKWTPFCHTPGWCR